MSQMYTGNSPQSYNIIQAVHSVSGSGTPVLSGHSDQWPCRPHTLIVDLMGLSYHECCRENDQPVASSSPIKVVVVREPIMRVIKPPTFKKKKKLIMV